MFDIKRTESGTINLAGRFDASQESRAQAVLDQVSESATVDFQELKYISSAGLAVLLRTQKKLMVSGQALKIVNISPQIRELLEIAGFDRIFDLD